MPIWLFHRIVPSSSTRHRNNHLDLPNSKSVRYNIGITATVRLAERPSGADAASASMPPGGEPVVPPSRFATHPPSKIATARRSTAGGLRSVRSAGRSATAASDHRPSRRSSSSAEASAAGTAASAGRSKSSFRLAVGVNETISRVTSPDEPRRGRRVSPHVPATTSVATAAPRQQGRAPYPQRPKAAAHARGRPRARQARYSGKESGSRAPMRSAELGGPGHGRNGLSGSDGTRARAWQYERRPGVAATFT
eukprot:scaffold10740_cov112-Isochrysis_galbana.AAC.2